MAPQPRRQNPQHQALTVTLKNICRDYPAGGGILRELLQNADDAGASEMAFTMDTRSYSASNLLHPGLAEYQGPALLAYNNAKFLPKDFESLSSIGASRKEQDAFATGKFGRGFSSVFNWTDCPSIVSDTTLFFLDPHHSWSADWSPPGGPEWDFTAHGQDDAMKNQLSAYSSFILDFHRPLEGTIVRIPLRTAVQAQKSAIRDQETTVSDVQSAMEGFAREIQHGGMLFLKSILKVSLFINDKHLATTEVVNKCEVMEARANIREALCKVLDGKAKVSEMRTEHIAFDIHFKHRSSDPDSSTDFTLHHTIEPNLSDNALVKWAGKNKLHPWVGIAAPILEADDVDFSGDLFTVLPLHIPTNQPVHIHGIFSVSPDRGKLHGPNDASVQDQRPEKWNRTLIKQLVPQAWIKLLERIALSHPLRSKYHLWPREPLQRHEMWDCLCSSLVNQASQNASLIWYTDIGYVSLCSGLLALEHDFVEQRQAFHDAGIPAIYLSDVIKKHAMTDTKAQKLCQRTVLNHLHSTSRVLNISDESKLILFEYLSSGLAITEIADLALFPFEDGKLRAISRHNSFIHRDDSEEVLFKGTPELNLNIRKVPPELLRKLRNFATKSPTSSLCFRRPEDLQAYCYKTVFRSKKTQKSMEMIDADEEILSFVNRVWTWVTRFNNRALTAIGPLWLVPLTNGKCRKVQPESASLLVTYTTVKDKKDILLKLASYQPASAPLILNSDALPDDAISMLNQTMSKNSTFAMRNADVFVHFLEWLDEGRHLLEQANPGEKARVLEMIVDWFWSCKNHDKLAKRLLHRLCVFKRVGRSELGGRIAIHQSWTDLTGPKVVGLKELKVIPPLTDITLIDTTNDRERGMIENFKLFDCLNTIEMIEKIVLPSLDSKGHVNCPRDVLQFLLSNFYHYSADSQAILARLPIIPLEMRTSSQPQKYAAAASLIDPAAKELAALFFDDEFFYPESAIFQVFAEPLRKCCLNTVLDRRIVLDRLDTYTSGRYSFEELFIRVKALLQLPLSKELQKDAEFLNIIMNKCWLPTYRHDSPHELTDPRNCRDQEDFYLVGQVLPTLPFKVRPSWRHCFKWQDPIAVDHLLSQISFGTEKSDLQIVNCVLSHMAKNPQRSGFLRLIKGMKVIWTSAKCFTHPEHAYQDGCQNLAPYLYNVEADFWSKHSKFLANLGVGVFPTSQKLLDLQRQLERKSPLTGTDLTVALEVTKMASLDSKSSFAGLKIPSEKGALIDLPNIAFNDLGPYDLPNSIFLTHPSISRDMAKRLKIEPLSERYLKGELEIPDVDEEEFDQREEIVDGIRDTLERYSKESTFHEYLANADDSGNASDVNWMLDENTYPSSKLITSKLKQFQGSSLLVHNNGVFLEKDFEGLKHVGRGSKRNDATTIGKFGRGSQTMYHWTDIPMILSGEFLLILDPQQLYLPMNYRTGRRKTGVKIRLSKLRQESQDQLTPFAGLWGYSLGLDYYNGTIFRFPLRKEGSKSELLNTSIHPFATVKITFQNAFETARLSLLFLKTIQKIDFQVRGKSFEWEVRMKKTDKEAFSGHRLVEVKKALLGGGMWCWTDRWLRAIKKLPDASSGLQYRQKRTMKQIECGIAILLRSEPSEAGTSEPEQVAPRFFNYLPLPIQLSLPVHVHATFLLSGDRQSISVEDRDKDAGSDWNKWMLENPIPQLYLAFLGCIGRVIGETLFSFFPSKDPTGDVLSDMIRSSFWNLLPSSNVHLYPVADRALVSDSVDAKRESGRPLPTHQLVRFQDATFDLLDMSTSRSLTLVLPFLVKNLVQPIQPLRKQMSQLSGIHAITPSVVRTALQSKEAIKHLLNSMKEEQNVLENLLCYVSPVKECDFMELINCRILPIADGTLGTLLPRSQSQSVYFFANATEIKLFPFAASLFISEEVQRKFIKQIRSSERFNVYRLDESHIKMLLNMKTNWPVIPDHGHNEWLAQFWKYMNDPYSANVTKTFYDATVNTYEKSELRQFPLHEARCGIDVHYASFEEFSDLPAVAEPVSPDERELCQSLPGLYLVDPETLPTSIYEAERFLSKPASLLRLLKAMSLLALRQGKKLPDYVRHSLNVLNLKILRQAVVSIFKGSSPLLNELKPFVRELPIWTSKSNDYLTALDALAAQNDLLVLPWSPQYSSFVSSGNDPSTLQKLGVRFLDDETMLRNHVIVNLPSRINYENKAVYLQLITAMNTMNNSQWVRNRSINSLLRQYSFAARRDGLMVKPSEIYDHGDKLFIAAFRFESTDRFLLNEVDGFQPFWRGAGIRCQTHGKISGDDYLACLNAVSKRLGSLQDSHLDADVSTVLHPLYRNRIVLSSLSRIHWLQLATIEVFPLLSDFGDQPQFRQEQMESLVNSRAALTLGEIISKDFIGICWSQVPFTSLEPSTWALAQVSKLGCPSSIMVWKHIEYMASIKATVQNSEIAAFLLDLQNCYDYLQIRVQESKESFHIPKSSIWLNVDDVQDLSSYQLQQSWQRLDHLILLSSCDAPPLMAIRSFLAPFAKLLSAIGCNSMVYPTFRTVVRDDLDSVASRMNDLRLRGYLTDVEFSVNGISLSAHRIVLAAKSEYCMSQFNGSWNTDEVVELDDMTPHTLENLFDYAYQDSFDWSPMQANADDDIDAIADKLDQLLDILVGADRWLMHDMKVDAEQQILQGNRLLIRADNVRAIKRVADEANAKSLEEYCQDFESKNVKAVSLANSDGIEDEIDSNDDEEAMQNVLKYQVWQPDHGGYESEWLA